FWAMMAVLNMPMYHMSTTPQNISEKATGTPIAMAPRREPTKTRSVMVSALRKLFDRQVLARELGDFVFRDAARQKTVQAFQCDDEHQATGEHADAVDPDHRQFGDGRMHAGIDAGLLPGSPEEDGG